MIAGILKTASTPTSNPIKLNAYGNISTGCKNETFVLNEYITSATFFWNTAGFRGISYKTS
jgi:hypothetical protein